MWKRDRPFSTEEGWADGEGLGIIYDIIVPRPTFPAPTLFPAPYCTVARRCSLSLALKKPDATLQAAMWRGPQGEGVTARKKWSPQSGNLQGAATARGMAVCPSLAEPQMNQSQPTVDTFLLRAWLSQARLQTHRKWEIMYVYCFKPLTLWCFVRQPWITNTKAAHL